MKLLPLIRTLDGSQPGQSMESSADVYILQNDTDDELSTDIPGGTKGTKRHLFTPAHKTTKTIKKAKAIGKMLTEMSSTMKEIEDVLVNDTTSELIDYLKEESRKQVEIDNMFMSLMNIYFLSNRRALQTQICTTYPRMA